MKFFLKVIASVFCCTGVCVYTLAIFDPSIPDAELHFAIIFMDMLMVLFLWLMWRKRKASKSKNEHSSVVETSIPSVEIKVSEVPEEILKDMRSCYTSDQIKNDLRIMNDCLDLIESTKNLETYFSRAELGMQKALTLQQAKQAGIKGLANADHIVQTFFNAVHSCKGSVLKRSFEAEKAKIAGLTTPRGKCNRWIKYLELLKSYEDEYEFDFSDDYGEIISYVERQIAELSSGLRSKGV